MKISGIPVDESLSSGYEGYLMRQLQKHHGYMAVIAWWSAIYYFGHHALKKLLDGNYEHTFVIGDGRVYTFVCPKYNGDSV